MNRENSRNEPISNILNTDRLGDEAYRRLEELFVTGDLVPGSMVSEAQLTKRIQMGRAPVSAAIKKFEALHLLKPVYRKGIFVSDVSLRDNLFLIELRTPIERLIFESAAKRATEQERQLLMEQKALFVEANEMSNREDILKADFEYKRVAIQATRNPFVEQAIGSIHILSRRFWNMNLSYENEPSYMDETVLHHTKIIDKTIKGDVEGAKKAVDRFMKFLLSVTNRMIKASISI